jgi:hypothetical protein
MNKKPFTIIALLFLVIINSFCQETDSIQKPELIVRDGKEYEVIRGKMTFKVDEKGKIKNAKVYEVNCLDCSKSELEKYKEQMKYSVMYSPAWTPGTDSLGNTISVDYDIPVTLEIERKSKKKSKKERK